MKASENARDFKIVFELFLFFRKENKHTNELIFPIPPNEASKILKLDIIALSTSDKFSYGSSHLIPSIFSQFYPPFINSRKILYLLVSGINYLCMG